VSGSPKILGKKILLNACYYKGYEAKAKNKIT
jgi:hypothetical protein